MFKKRKQGVGFNIQRLQKLIFCHNFKNISGSVENIGWVTKIGEFSNKMRNLGGG